ncbi:MAG: lysophospholipid acyltransferase family protein [Terrimicrobiaceae bacterium]|jgi:1-acyl-sn-glycerol-3-phosphate acyltransferase
MPSLEAGERFVESLQLSDQRSRFSFRVGDYFRQIVATGLFFLGGLMVSPICWMLRRVAGRWISYADGQWILHHLFRWYVAWLRFSRCLVLEIEGEETLRKLRGTVIAANHPGLLDAFFLVALQPRTACVMRANLLRNPVLSGCALLAGYVTNDSGSTLVRQGIEKIREGGNLLIFPEGTRTRHHAVNSFKSGFALVAVKAGAPVQTVIIEREGHHLTKGSGLFLPASLPLRFKIRPGRQFVPEPGESARALTARLESWFRSQIINTGDGIQSRPASLP